ncbi:hypothetical protein ACMD2_15924, partial [Ananas comosus]
KLVTTEPMFLLELHSLSYIFITLYIVKEN